MGEVIHAEFGSERLWAQARDATAEELVAVGELSGDDASLMRAKADCLHRLLRTIVEETPPLNIRCSLPEDLTTEQLEAIREVIHEAALAALQAGVDHAVRSVIESAPDLCTSMLAHAGE